MSKELKIITVNIELPVADKQSKYYPTRIALKKFNGGSKNGQSLQIDFYDEKHVFRHLQMNNEEVKTLLMELTKNF